MMDFMVELRFHNNKDFMAANKSRYIAQMRDPHYALIETLAPAMLAIDPHMEVRPYKALSRIFRDTRFSRDKSPYRDHHWIAFRRQAEPRESSVVFWFEVRIEGLSWGLGFWGENRPAMNLMRQRMESHPDDMAALLPGLKRGGLSISGEAYKRMAVPQDLHPQLKPYYALKDLYIVPAKPPDPGMAFGPGLVPRLLKDFETLAPWYRLLRGYHDLSQMEGIS